MRIKAVHDLRRFLKEHGNFTECIIEELALSDYGTTFTVSMSCGWVQRSRMQQNESSPPTYICLSFHLVQELHFRNGLNAAMLTSPESLNWGLNEVSVVQVVEEDPILWPSPQQEKRFLRVAFLWEGERRIDVVFSDLDVEIRDAQN